MLTRPEARALTDAIRDDPGGRWARVAEAYGGRAAEALGHRSWAAYCEAEFGPDRLRIPTRMRRAVLTQLRSAGMTIDDVQAVAVRGGRRRPAPPASRSPRIEDELGFTPSQLDLIGALLEVDDEEFGRVLAAGQRRNDLSGAFVRSSCWEVVRRRSGVERHLERAVRALERARELVGRSADGGAPGVAVQGLLREIEDQAWDLLDDVDGLHARLARAETGVADGGLTVR